MSLPVIQKKWGSPALLSVLLAATLTATSPQYATPQQFKWTALAGLVAVLCWAAGVAALRTRRLRLDALDLLTASFLAWACASLFYSADAYAGMEAIVQFALGAAVFCLVKNQATALATALSWGVTTALAAVLAFDGLDLFKWGGFYNENFGTEFILLALPFAGFAVLCSNRWLAALPLTASGAALLHLLGSNPSKIEFFVFLCAVFAGVLWLIGRRSRGLAALLGVLTPCLGAWAVWTQPTLALLRESLEPRVPLFLDTLLLWADRPWLGWGAGSFAAAFPLYKTRHLAILGDLRADWLGRHDLTLSPHNEYLHFLAEYGLAGWIFPIAAAYLLWRGARNVGQLGLGAPGRLGAVVVFMGLANAIIEFPLRNPATAILFAAGLGLFAGQIRDGLWSRTLALEHLGGKIAAGLAFLAIGLSSAGFAWRYDASARAYGSALASRYGDSEIPFRLELAAHRWWPGSTEARLDLFMILMQWTRQAGGFPLAPLGYDEVFEISLSSGPHRALLLERLQYLLESGRYRERQEETEHWLAMAAQHHGLDAEVWIDQAHYHYLTERLPQARQFLAQAQEALARAQAHPRLGDAKQMEEERLELAEQAILIGELDRMISEAENIAAPHARRRSSPAE